MKKIWFFVALIAFPIEAMAGHSGSGLLMILILMEMIFMIPVVVGVVVFRLLRFNALTAFSILSVSMILLTYFLTDVPTSEKFYILFSRCMATFIFLVPTFCLSWWLYGQLALLGKRSVDETQSKRSQDEA